MISISCRIKTGFALSIFAYNKKPVIVKVNNDIKNHFNGVIMKNRTSILKPEVIGLITGLV
ncbi:MAG TPA: hypothetical protein PLI20_07575, partial [Bacillota bacterium]|nr:hypothetical protein [Bacillota bacterium]